MFEPGHLSRVAELMRHLWSPHPDRNAAYLDWKYRRNPYITEPLIYLAFDGDRLAGMRGCFGTRWVAGDAGESCVMPYPDDLIVEPAYRTRGLHRVIMGVALEDLRRRGYRYAVNLSATRYTMLASQRMKWRIAGTMGAVVRRSPRCRLADGAADALRRLPGAWRWADRVALCGGRSGDRVFERLDRRLATPRRSACPVQVQDRPRVADMAALAAALPRDGRIRHVRDEAYFRWRFANPFRSYRFVFVGGDRLEGYLVLQHGLDVPGTRVSIVDAEATNERAAARLLGAVLEMGAFPAVRAWSVGASASWVALLAQHGFQAIDESHQHVIMARSLGAGELRQPWLLGGRSLDTRADWDLRMIDSMVG